RLFFQLTEQGSDKFGQVRVAFFRERKPEFLFFRRAANNDLSRLFRACPLPAVCWSPLQCMGRAITVNTFSHHPSDFAANCTQVIGDLTMYIGGQPVSYGAFHQLIGIIPCSYSCITTARSCHFHCSLSFFCGLQIVSAVIVFSCFFQQFNAFFNTHFPTCHAVCSLFCWWKYPAA